MAITVGTMLDPKEQARAIAFAAQYLAKPLREYREKGGEWTASLSDLIMDAGEPLDDIDQRWDQGAIVGNLFKVLFVLSNDPKYRERASWRLAADVLIAQGKKRKGAGALSSIMKAKTEFLTVAHLWAAASYRGRPRRNFLQEDPATGYSFAIDFQFFLAEAEDFRRWGQNWKRRATNAEPPLPADVWQMHDEWHAPNHEPSWPNTGRIARPTPGTLDMYIPGAKRRGRPKKG